LIFAQLSSCFSILSSLNFLPHVLHSTLVSTTLFYFATNPDAALIF
jgi:hypothetical protein